jgi:DNA-binding transcriptional ArsR family regulator
VKSRLDRRLVALFGSETRLRTLGVLANSYRPLTGYRIGRTAGVALPKVYRELKRLRSAGLVVQAHGGWVLSDADVGTLLRKRFHVTWEPDWSAEIARRAPADRAILARLRALPPPKFPRAWTPRRPARFRRRAVKDRLLLQMGSGTSLHGDPPGV